MGNAACSSCCWWWRDAPVDSKKTDGDEKDGDSAWIKQGSVPLVTARYDSDGMDTECVVKKTVVMRSPRPAAGSVSSVAPIPTSLSSRGSSRTKSDDGGSDDRHSTRARHETGGSMSAGLVSDSHDRVHGSPSSHRISSSSPRHHSSPSASASSSVSSPHRRKKNRAAGLRPLDPPSDDEVKASALTVDDEVETKEREFAAPKDADDSSPLANASEPLDAASQSAARHSDHDSHHCHHHREDLIDQQQDDDADEQQQEEEPPRSPRSTRSASHDSTGSGSTKRKARYGRKNYRANSNRKKTH